MKDAMGELNMTVVTIVAIGAVAAFFTVILWPQIRDKINAGWEKVDEQDPVVQKIEIPDYFDIPNIYE